MMHTERVTFESRDETLVGTLHVPDGPGPSSAVVTEGPLTSVKEQATGNHARAMAERGFVALAFDHRYFGESSGTPRQYESPTAKIEDLRAALDFLAARPEVDAARLNVLGICAGAGYAAGLVATDARVAAFGAVAGFFHDVAQQRLWMGDAAFDRAIAEAEGARERYRSTGEVTTIPAVGKGDGPVAMPLDEAYEYYGTPRGAVPGYVNAFATLSRAETLPYDAQGLGSRIAIPTILVHSERALAPSLARKFFAGLAGPKQIEWVTSKGQVDFYDDPAQLAIASDLVAAYFRSAPRR